MSDGSLLSEIENLGDNTFLDELENLDLDNLEPRPDRVDSSREIRCTWITTESGVLKPNIEIEEPDIIAMTELMEGDIHVGATQITKNGIVIAVLDVVHWWPAPPGMRNKGMAEVLRSRQALDISSCDEVGENLFRLPFFVKNLRYCHAVREVWVQEIGESITRNEIVASLEKGKLNTQEFNNLYDFSKKG
jgi:hypothetical protein